MNGSSSVVTTPTLGPPSQEGHQITGGRISRSGVWTVAGGPRNHQRTTPPPPGRGQSNWAHLFGRGLVATPGDLGDGSHQPPELLITWPSRSARWMGHQHMIRRLVHTRPIGGIPWPISAMARINCDSPPRELRGLIEAIGPDAALAGTLDEKHTARQWPSTSPVP